ncbi:MULTISPECIES: hypothetical protein [Nitrosarchaeum]|jgi:uncharacterized membrane protein YeaQ/YmgE (transglycosylase-associated protein family)|uniref:Uncharacterized protein n=1 Tax=Nitrosarchaeum koreense MY1 TaxID=1001994 RepID=F9CWI5_9ARCH|nr:MULTISPECIES: hypothetical protein [Nitrosarchaeum]EGP93637.1 hypothetical protein MY1_0875 [Nitrosarchaeum koreense MY1]MEC4848367.1 hypothetical protein [Nitrosarchaeum sp.]QLH10930.1 hypothetical protein DSQ20_05180 [Nitrosarchaeum sp. AC2]
MENIKSRSNGWYVLPIFLGWIGGLIAYFILRRDDPRKAKNCLYLGIILGIVGLILNIIIIAQMPEFTPTFNANI